MDYFRFCLPAEALTVCSPTFVVFVAIHLVPCSVCPFGHTVGFVCSLLLMVDGGFGLAAFAFAAAAAAFVFNPS